MDAIKVVLVDDHTLFRKSLRSLLSQDELIEVVGEADGLDGLKELLPTIDSDGVQVVLMDYHLGDALPDGIEAMEWVREHHSGLQVLLLTMYDDRDTVLRAAQAGARGYVLKDAEVDELVFAIKAASEGKTYLSPGIAERAISELAKVPLCDHADSARHTAETYGLTPREMDVVGRVVQGMTYSAIARELEVSVSQIKQLTGSLFAKLGANDKAHAAAIAVARGLVPPPL